MQFDLAMTDALLSTTRAVRKRLDLEKPVPREVLLECIALSPAGADRKQHARLALGDCRGCRQADRAR